MSGLKERLTKPLILRNAAVTMANWLVKNQITALGLEQRLRAGEDVLASALHEVDKNAIAAARAMAGGVLQHLGEADAKQILALLWEIPPVRDHALVLGRSDIYQTYYLPAIERVKQWLQTGSPN